MTESETTSTPGNAPTDSVPPALTMVLPVTGPAADTLTCCRSLASALPDGPAEVIVVDIGASPEVRAVVARLSGDVHVIDAPTGTGAAAALDIAVERARGHLLLAVGDGTVLLPGFLDALVQCLADDPRVAVVTSRTVDLAGRTVPQPWFDAAEPSRVTDEDDLLGLCALWRTSALREVGRLSPAGSLLQRVAAGGWRAVRSSDSVVIAPAASATAVGSPATFSIPPILKAPAIHAAGESARALVIARVGDESLHGTWCAPRSERTFDVALDYYGDDPGRYADECDFYTHTPGTKFPAVATWIHDHGDVLDNYDFVFLPDDDLACSPGDIERLVRVAAAFDLWLAQPALTAESYHSYPFTVQDETALLRFTDFVEIMAPIFSREALRRCAPSFTLTRSGWGLDFLWPFLLGRPSRSIAVIDAAPVHHGRPLGTGPLYRELAVAPETEMHAVAGLFNLSVPYSPAVLEVVPIEVADHLRLFARSEHPAGRRAMYAP